jgi:hypothetical protein
MRKLLPLLFLSVCCSASAEWSLICQSDSGDDFLDAEKIEKIGKNRRVWVLHNFLEIDYSRGLPVASTVRLDEYSCQEKKATTLQESWFSEKSAGGKVLTPKNLERGGQWWFVLPKSCGEAIMKQVCSQ